MTSHFERMLQLADEVFASRTDPNQLDVNEEVLDHLRAIHPACVSAHEVDNGPVAWVLIIPTTFELMRQFMADQITERELYERTPLNAKYQTVYLCSAMVLVEFRKQGLAKRLSVQAIKSIAKDHSIETLFVWTFSEEGLIAAQSIAKEVHLPVLIRQ